jgi:hypothetical protein
MAKNRRLNKNKGNDKYGKLLGERKCMKGELRILGIKIKSWKNVKNTLETFLPMY